MAPTVLSTEGIREIRMIEDIEKLGAELHVETLTEPEIFQSGKVHVAETKVAENIAPHGAERSQSWRKHDGTVDLIAAKRS